MGGGRGGEGVGGERGRLHSYIHITAFHLEFTFFFFDDSIYVSNPLQKSHSIMQKKRKANFPFYGETTPFYAKHDFTYENVVSRKL